MDPLALILLIVVILAIAGAAAVEKPGRVPLVVSAASVN